MTLPWQFTLTVLGVVGLAVFLWSMKWFTSWVERRRSR